MRRFRDGVLKVSSIMEIVGGVALIFILTLTTADVILRALGRPILGTYEIVGICGGVVIGFVAPMTSWARGHISMDFLVNRLSKGGKNLINISTRFVGIVAFLVISWNALLIGNTFRTDREVTASLHIPFYPIAYGLAICFFMLSLVLFCDVLKILEGSYE